MPLLKQPTPPPLIAPSADGQALPDLSLPAPARGDVLPGQPLPTAPPALPPARSTAMQDLVPRQILPNLSVPGSVSVTLAPADLGTLRFEVSARGDSLHLHLMVDTAATLDLLRRQGDQMLAELRQAGFANASLSFAASDGQSGGQSGGQSAGQSGGQANSQTGGEPRHGQQGGDATRATTDPEPTALRDSRARPTASGTLDLRL